jgi:CheY-like chemotaxis protein/HPt (histidine-containing phosphotransfer) domain-containing protein
VDSRRVLVVDDNASARGAIVGMLAGLGFAGDAVESGASALACLTGAVEAGTPYEYVLVDWCMPAPDGLETIDAIRNAFPEACPILILMSEVSVGTEDVPVLSKPVMPSRLQRVLTGSAPAAAEEAGTPQNPHAILRGTRVLVAEDDATNQVVIRGLLHAVGIKADIAADGVAAVELAARGDYEIVLMDMQMPRMGGLEATGLIRADPRLAELPVVALTANAVGGHRETCLAAGMNDFVSKPFQPDELYGVIEKWVTGSADSLMDDADDLAELSGADLVLPADIPGLDVRAGLRRVSGLKGLYVESLESFVRNQTDAADRIRAAIGRGDIVTAIRDAHTLKSAAGMVEAGVVRMVAANMEAQLQSGAVEEAMADIDKLDKILGNLVADIADNVDLSALML